MYFSLITPKVGLEKDAALDWAKGPYAQHQWLWQFLKAPEGTSRDFLFRCRDGENRLPGFYVVSKRQPVAINEAWEVQSRIYDPVLKSGQRLMFELRANPTVTKKVDGKSRRSDVVMDQKKTLLEERGLRRWKDWSDEDSDKPSLYALVQDLCENWLERKSESCGFRLVVNSDTDAACKKVQVDAYQQHRFGKKDIQFSTVDFSGVLEVTDTELFQKRLVEGIGHAKAFGCGLLLVRPPV